MTDQNDPEQPAPPEPRPELVEGARPEPVEGMRSFSLNSREFYEAVREPQPSWCWGPGNPQHPPSWTPRAIPGVLWIPSEEAEWPFE